MVKNSFLDFYVTFRAKSMKSKKDRCRKLQLQPRLFRTVKVFMLDLFLLINCLSIVCLIFESFIVDSVKFEFCAHVGSTTGQLAAEETSWERLSHCLQVSPEVHPEGWRNCDCKLHKLFVDVSI